LPEEWKESIILPIYKGDKTYCSNYRGISLVSTTQKFYPPFCCQGYLTPYVEEIIGDRQCGF